MPTPEELEEALKKFRLSILDALADMSTKVTALEWAVEEAGVRADRITELRKKAKETLHEKHRKQFAERISMPHELR
jgi:hypothetical protein